MNNNEIAEIKKKDQVAIVNITSGVSIGDHEQRIYIHASVPYISTIEGHHYPYVKNVIDPKFYDNITKVISAVKLEFSANLPKRSGRIDSSNYSKVFSPKQISASKNYRYTLSRTATTITDEINLGYIVNFLFSLEDEIDLLKIFMDNENFIPWDWIYDKQKKKFLCELFGIGVIFSETKEISKTLQRGKHISLSKKQLQSSDYKALIIGNTYISLPTDTLLAKMKSSIDNIANMVEEKFSHNDTIVKIDANLNDIKENLVDQAEVLRLIYISGHFHNIGFKSSDNKFLTENALFGALDSAGKDQFSAHPIVFLNGCSSVFAGQDQLRPSVDSIHNLAMAFLKLGAAACIITSMEVRLQHAAKFAEEFFSCFLTPGISIGSAIKYARSKLDHSKTFEWAAYHLFGDPAHVLIKSE